ncbi:hypothetical protein Droror1_Dr00026138 [Drosera rotundifolia]
MVATRSAAAREAATAARRASSKMTRARSLTLDVDCCVEAPMPPAKRKSIASSESSGGGSGVVIVCGMISSSTAGTPTPRSQSQPRSRRGKTSRTVTKRSKKNRWILRRIRVWPLATISTRSSQNISNDVMKPRI